MRDQTIQVSVPVKGGKPIEITATLDGAFGGNVAGLATGETFFNITMTRDGAIVDKQKELTDMLESYLTEAKVVWMDQAGGKAREVESGHYVITTSDGAIQLHLPMDDGMFEALDRYRTDLKNILEGLTAEHLGLESPTQQQFTAAAQKPETVKMVRLDDVLKAIKSHKDDYAAFSESVGNPSKPEVNTLLDLMSVALSDKAVAIQAQHIPSRSPAK